MRHNNPFRPSTATHTALELIVKNAGMLEINKDGVVTSGGSKLRKHCTVELMQQTGMKEGSVGAAYTTAKREAVSQGIVPEYGRGGRSVPVTVRSVDVAEANNLKSVVHKGVTEFEAYALIDKSDGKLVVLQHALKEQEENAKREAAEKAREEKAAKAKAEREAKKAEKAAAKQAEKAKADKAANAKKSTAKSTAKNSGKK